MSTPQHTPGPWFQESPDTVSDSNGGLVAAVYPGAPRASQIDANARLIAAAPELLEALQRLLTAPEGSTMALGCHDSGPHYVAACDAWDTARAAINKATQPDQ